MLIRSSLHIENVQLHINDIILACVRSASFRQDGRTTGAVKVTGRKGRRLLVFAGQDDGDNDKDLAERLAKSVQLR